MKLTHNFAELTPDKRPRKTRIWTARVCASKPMQHGGEYASRPRRSLRLIPWRDEGSHRSSTVKTRCEQDRTDCIYLTCHTSSLSFIDDMVFPSPV
jgi:hypothetical protein